MSHATIQKIWDAWCCISVIGVWPRYIEPRLLKTSRHDIFIQDLPKDLEGLKIVQFSDLHIGPYTSKSLLARLIKKIQKEKPDLVLFTGDFLCESKIHDANLLISTLNQIQAPLGCYAVLGNHDYNKPLCINPYGAYDVSTKKKAALLRAFKRLYKRVLPTGEVTNQARSLRPHAQLRSLLKSTPFHLLENETVVIPIKNSFLNVCGLGEYMTGQADKRKAMQNYNLNFPGIILVHNPDAIPSLDNAPGDIILCGHTHGNQVNLPFFKRAFASIENQDYYRGSFKRGSKWIYVNRGIGASFPFRWRASPEILVATIKGKSNHEFN